MKCERCHEKTLCRKIEFDPIEGKILYICTDCTIWLYSYIINEVFIITPPTSDEDSDDEEPKDLCDYCCKGIKKYHDDGWTCSSCDRGIAW